MASSLPLTKAKATLASLQVIPLNHSFWLHQYPITSPLPESIQAKLFQPVISPDKPPCVTQACYADFGRNFLSVTRTEEEWSVMIQENEEDELESREGSSKEGPWGCLKVRGPMVLSGCLKVRGPMVLTLKGIAADLTAHLASAGIPVFLISTWNKDYVFVKKDLQDRAVEALRKGGWVIA